MGNSSNTNSKVAAVGFATLILLCVVVAYQRQANSALVPSIWAVSSMERIGQHDQAGNLAKIELSAARGEYEAFQVGIQAGGQDLTNVRFSISDLQGPGSQVISKSNVTLYREHYVHVRKSSPNRGGTNQPLGAGWYPDALIPFIDPVTQQAPVAATFRAIPFDLKAATNQPIWIDIFVPRDARAGYYTGTFTVQSDQIERTGEFGLTVWNFTLPLRPSLKSLFLLWSTKTSEAKRELLKHKLMPNSIEVYEQQPFIDGFGLNAINAGFWSGAQIDSCAMRPAPAISDLRATAQEMPAELLRYNYTADEVDACPNLYDAMKQWAQRLHQAGIANLVTMKPVPTLLDDGTGSGRSVVDIWVLLPKMYDAAPERVDQVLRKGDQVWSYNALVQEDYSPKWEIDFAPINFRIQPGFISQSLGLTGVLYWRVDNWTNDPWNDVQTYISHGEEYPGEGMLVYPGEPAGIKGVVPSMRLKWLREGIEDYEYIELLKQRGAGAWGLSVAHSAGANWSRWTNDPSALAQARQQLGIALDQPAAKP